MQCRPPVRWEELPGASHSATMRKGKMTFTTCARLSLRRYVRIPVELTSLKPEAASRIYSGLRPIATKNLTRIIFRHGYARRRPRGVGRGGAGGFGGSNGGGKRQAEPSRACNECHCRSSLDNI